MHRQRRQGARAARRRKPTAADLLVLPELFSTATREKDLVHETGVQAACRAAIEEMARRGPRAAVRRCDLLIGTPWVEDGQDL